MARVKAMVSKDNAPDILLGTGHLLNRSFFAGRKPKVYDPTP